MSEKVEKKPDEIDFGSCLEKSLKDCDCSDQDVKGLLRVFGVIILIIIIWFCVLSFISGSGMNPGGNVSVDPMNIKLFSMNILNGEDEPFENCCSSWPISHLVLFFVLGLLFPNCDALVIGAGALWEGIECLGGFFSGAIANGKYQPRKNMETGTVEYAGSWWSGSMKDIIVDIAGFYLGKLCVNILDLNIRIKGINCA